LRSHGAGSRPRLGWTRRWSIRRIAARVTIASETSGQRLAGAGIPNQCAISGCPHGGPQAGNRPQRRQRGEDQPSNPVTSPLRKRGLSDATRTVVPPAPLTVPLPGAQRSLAGKERNCPRPRRCRPGLRRSTPTRMTSASRYTTAAQLRCATNLRSWGGAG
jgi:hypothetical protein